MPDTHDRPRRPASTPLTRAVIKAEFAILALLRPAGDHTPEQDVELVGLLMDLVARAQQLRK